MYSIYLHTAPAAGPQVCKLYNLYTEYKYQHHFVQSAAAAVTVMWQ